MRPITAIIIVIIIILVALYATAFFVSYSLPSGRERNIIIESYIAMVIFTIIGLLTSGSGLIFFIVLIGLVFLIAFIVNLIYINRLTNVHAKTVLTGVSIAIFVVLMIGSIVIAAQAIKTIGGALVKATTGADFSSFIPREKDQPIVVVSSEKTSTNAQSNQGNNG